MLPKNQMVASHGNIMEDNASSSLDEDIFQHSKQLERARRDLHRIQESVTYRLGQHITDAVRSKWKIPFLPISFPIAIFLLGLEKIGLRPHPKTERDYGESMYRGMLYYYSLQMVLVLGTSPECMV